MINKKLKNTALIILAVSILALMLSGCIEETKKENKKETTPSSNPVQQVSQDAKTNLSGLSDNKFSVAVFKIDQMSCGGCVEIIKTAISKVNGVNKYEVYFGRPGKAVVEYDPKIVTPEEISSAITKSGYPAELISSEEASKIQETVSPGSCGGSCGSSSTGGCGCGG